ncbi:hypothetical protein EAI30_03060 [Romboutsia ilealis]|nr:hypothetical protein [Romboutsia ilealis]
MKIKLKISNYLLIYILFLTLYIFTFKGNINYINLKICLTSSIFPALVGGSVINLFFKRHINYK